MSDLFKKVLENKKFKELLSKVEENDKLIIKNIVENFSNDLENKLIKPLKKSIEEITDKINERTLEELLALVKKGELDKGALRGVFSDIMNGILLKDSIKKEEISDDKISEEISKIIKEKPGLRANAYMGLVMAKFKGKIDAKRAMEIINKIIEGK